MCVCVCALVEGIAVDGGDLAPLSATELKFPRTVRLRVVQDFPNQPYERCFGKELDEKWWNLPSELLQNCPKLLTLKPLTRVAPEA